MARLILTPQTLLPSYPTTPLVANSADFVWTDAGASFADGAGFQLTGKEILLVQNANAGAQTVTISSVVDPYARTGNITAYSVGIAEFAVFPMFPVDGWRQADGQLYFAATATDVKFAVLRLP
jgi:hypothetical protein